MTARDLISGSLRLIGILAPGETPDASEEIDALQALNDLLETWSIEGQLTYLRLRETHSLVGGQMIQTMGPFGDIDTVRPVRIVAASILTGGEETPLDIITLEQFAEIALKSTESSIPQKMYPDYSNQLVNLNFYPVPVAGIDVVLYCEKPFNTISSPNTVVSFPPGYSRALKYNLAVELAQEYGREVSALVLEAALDSKNIIIRQNTEPVYAVSDAFGLASRKPFDWRIGE